MDVLPANVKGNTQSSPAAGPEETEHVVEGAPDWVETGEGEGEVEGAPDWVETGAPLLCKASLKSAPLLLAPVVVV